MYASSIISSSVINTIDVKTIDNNENIDVKKVLSSVYNVFELNGEP